MNIISFGGGTNSTAMIIGIHQRGIPIDMIVFADTGGEKPHTYEFIETLNIYLAARGLPEITVVRKVDENGDVMTLEDHCQKYNRLPGVAYGISDCAVCYKIGPQEKFCNNHPECKAAWKNGEKVNKFIGYDAGEGRRINKRAERDAADKKYTYHYPLIDWGWGRDECVAAIQSEGLPLPGKSSCFFCPNNRKPEIQALWENHPDLFDRAVAIEHNARKQKRSGKPTVIIGLGREWTWESYRDTYLHNAAFLADHFVLPGFEDITGGCCCGMPCGCNEE